jgi:RNA polymerase primary sigma factor
MSSTRAISDELERRAPVTDTLALYFREIGRYPLLDAGQEVRLAKRIERGDRDARDQLITSNLRLVVYVAKRFTGSGLQFVDLVQDGTLGLIRAVDRYDWRRGCRFSTYAMWWIRQAVQRGIHRSAGTIRLPVNMLERMRELRTLELQLLVQLQREPTDDEVGRAAGLSPAEVREISRVAAQNAQSPLSLDEQYGETGTLVDVVPAAKSVEDEIDPRLDSQAVHDALDGLPGLEREVVRLKYGIGENQARTMDDIGDALGISRDQVRKLERLALRRLWWSPQLQAIRG